MALNGIPRPTTTLFSSLHQVIHFSVALSRSISAEGLFPLTGSNTQIINFLLGLELLNQGLSNQPAH